MALQEHQKWRISSLSLESKTPLVIYFPSNYTALMKLALALLLLTPLPALAWDGTLRGPGDYIEIERGMLVREGETIQYYDHDTAETYEAEVESVDENNGTTNVIVTDADTGETQILEME